MQNMFSIYLGNGVYQNFRTEMAMEGNTVDKYRLARIAYAAYGKTTDFKNFQGNPMPEFSVLPDKIKEAWLAACEAVESDVAADMGRG